MKDWKDKYDTPKHGLIAFLVMILIGLNLSYFTFIYPSSLKAFFSILLYKKNDLQTQLFTLSVLPAMFMFYFIQFRWQMNRASQVYVGCILFLATIMMAIKFL